MAWVEPDSLVWVNLVLACGYAVWSVVVVSGMSICDLGLAYSNAGPVEFSALDVFRMLGFLFVLSVTEFVFVLILAYSFFGCCMSVAVGDGLGLDVVWSVEVVGRLSSVELSLGVWSLGVTAYHSVYSVVGSVVDVECTAAPGYFIPLCGALVSSGCCDAETASALFIVCRIDAVGVVICAAGVAWAVVFVVLDSVRSDCRCIVDVVVLVLPVLSFT